MECAVSHSSHHPLRNGAVLRSPWFACRNVRRIRVIIPCVTGRCCEVACAKQEYGGSSPSAVIIPCVTGRCCEAGIAWALRRAPARRVIIPCVTGRCCEVCVTVAFGPTSTISHHPLRNGAVLRSTLRFVLAVTQKSVIIPCVTGRCCEGRASFRALGRPRASGLRGGSLASRFWR